MAKEVSNNKLIAKNTIALYVRMLFAMIVSLYTSRVVLEYLGETDYGIQNVVAGIVTMFAFLSNTLASASQRYFAFELGRNNISRLQKIFSLTTLLYLIVIAIIVLLAETVGIWFVNEKMCISADRLYAANVVFQLSILSFCVTIFATPYQAIIIARERMDVYALVGILDAVLHLLFVLFLQYFISNYDCLIAYGFVMLLYKCICQFLYVYYASSKFKESKFVFCWDGSLAKEMLSYSAWNVFGAVAQICRSQGINMLISVFFLPVVNAARGIAYQVENALNVFATNFYTAVRPQVTKRYASGDVNSAMSLVYSSSKFTYFLLAFVSVPMIVFIEHIIGIWLVKVPELAPVFTKLVIIMALIDSLSNPLMTIMQATGKVKIYQLVTGTLVLLNFPISWIFLYCGYSAEYTMYVGILIALISLLSRLIIVKHYVGFSLRKYFKYVLTRVVIVTFCALLISQTISVLILSDLSIFNVLSSYTLSVLVTIGLIYFIGLTKDEREVITQIIQKRIRR